MRFLKVEIKITVSVISNFCEPNFLQNNVKFDKLTTFEQT